MTICDLIGEFLNGMLTVAVVVMAQWGLLGICFSVA